MPFGEIDVVGALTTLVALLPLAWTLLIAVSAIVEDHAFPLLGSEPSSDLETPPTSLEADVDEVA